MLIPDIIEQHWEEAGFLWGLRRGAVANPAFSLRTLCELDERVEAHLDGLRIAGEEGWRLCQRVALWEDPGEVFVGGVLSLESADSARWEDVLQRVRANPALGRGLAGALGWVAAGAAQGEISRLLSAASPIERRIGISGAVAHRLRLDGTLTSALGDADESLRARAYRAAAELGRVDLVGNLRAGLGAAGEPGFWAAWALAILQADAEALRVLEGQVATPAFQIPAAQVLFRRLEPAAAARLHQRLAGDPGHSRLAMASTGMIGDPALVPWLLGQMSKPESSRLAADAFQTITGADFVRDRLRRNSPPRPPVAEDAGADAPPDPDTDLTWPEPDAIRKWWQERGRQFNAGTRYLLGRPINPESLRMTLLEGQQHQRAAAAVELGIRSSGEPLFNVRAPGVRQRAALAAGAARVG